MYTFQKKKALLKCFFNTILKFLLTLVTPKADSAGENSYVGSKFYSGMKWQRFSKKKPFPGVGMILYQVSLKDEECLTLHYNALNFR